MLTVGTPGATWKLPNEVKLGNVQIHDDTDKQGLNKIENVQEVTVDPKLLLSLRFWVI